MWEWKQWHNEDADSLHEFKHKHLSILEKSDNGELKYLFIHFNRQWSWHLILSVPLVPYLETYHLTIFITIIWIIILSSFRLLRLRKSLQGKFTIIPSNTCQICRHPLIHETFSFLFLNNTVNNLRIEPTIYEGRLSWVSIIYTVF